MPKSSKTPTCKTKREAFSQIKKFSYYQYKKKLTTDIANSSKKRREKAKKPELQLDRKSQDMVSIASQKLRVGV